MNFHPFPILQTERLLLRHISKADAEDIFVFRSDSEVMRYIPRPVAKSIEDVYPLVALLDEFLDKGERVNWGIELKETKKIVGMIGFVNIKPEHFRAEVGYVLASQYHRKGIMFEALEAIVAYGFDKLNLHSVEAIVDADNEASNKLLLKFGFLKEAYFREDFYHNTSFRNSVHFGLLKNEFIRSK